MMLFGMNWFGAFITLFTFKDKIIKMDDANNKITCLDEDEY